MLIDTHCHLHDRDFFSTEQAEKAIIKAHQNGVNKIVCIGTSHEDSLVARDFAETHDDVFWTYGIHPEHATAKQSLATYDLNSPKLIGIGEVGLDYHYDGYNREAQIRLFEEMLHLAERQKLPLSFHVREAFDDFFPVVSNFPKIRGVVHSFSDNKKNLKRILNETDFYVGVNGMATYSTLPTPPIERILLETDAPFLAPVPFRSQQNEPGLVLEVAKWLASKLGLTLDEIEDITTKNAERLFSI